MISCAILLKKRKDKREKRIGLPHLWQIATGIFLYSPWREKTDIAKIYRGHSRRWRRVNLALSTYLQTSELLKCPSPPIHCQICSGPWQPLTGKPEPPTPWPWQPQKEDELCVPSICHKARERGRQIYCWHLWALGHLQRRNWMGHREQAVIPFYLPHNTHWRSEARRPMSHGISE